MKVVAAEKVTLILMDKVMEEVMEVEVVNRLKEKAPVWVMVPERVLVKE